MFLFVYRLSNYNIIQNILVSRIPTIVIVMVALLLLSRSR